MGIIDCHVHLYPPEVGRSPAAWAAAAGEKHWATLCARVRKGGQPVQGFPTVDQLLNAMDSAGVSRAVLLGWYWENHDTCLVQNRFLEECIRGHGDRLSACASFHPDAGIEAVRNEIGWAKDHGFCGLGELSPHSQHIALADPAWVEALRLAGEMNLPVNLHVTDSSGAAYPGRVETPLEDFVHLAKSFPRTTFVLAHWGARLPLFEKYSAELGTLPNLYFDTAASPLLYGVEVFRTMIDAVGANRILFGSDYPLILFPRQENSPMIKSFVEQVNASRLTDVERENIFRGTAKHVFSLG